MPFKHGFLGNVKREQGFCGCTFPFSLLSIARFSSAFLFFFTEILQRKNVQQPRSERLARESLISFHFLFQKKEKKKENSA